MPTSIVTAARPLTSAGHLLRADTGAVSAAMESFLGRLYTTGAEVHHPAHVAHTLSPAMEYLTRGVDGEFPTRVLLLESSAGWTVVFNNAWRSRGWYEMGFSLTKALETEDVYFLSQPNTIRKNGGQLRGQYGGVQFVHIDRGDVVRSISLVNDGGRWVFTTRGEPAPFETVQHYEAPKKSNRFSPTLLETYLGSMGLFPFRDDFYLVDEMHPAIGIEIVVSRPRQPNQFVPISLEQVKDAYGPFE